MITTRQLKWLNYAVDVSSTATHYQWRVGAVLVKGGRVLSMGVNRYRNLPSQVDLEGVSYHAEEVALKRAGDVEGATIFVARVTRSGHLGLAKPCERCQELLHAHGVHSAVWTEPTGFGKAKIDDLIFSRI
jgi:pyrimidine deaminase RibD-like protein